MSEWKNLEIDNLPPDILTGDYEWEYYMGDGVWGSASDWCYPQHKGRQIQKVVNGTSRYRYRKPEPKQPTHEEIMTKWWKNEEYWRKVNQYINGQYLLHGSGLWKGKEWFTGRESADIPPETE